MRRTLALLLGLVIPFLAVAQTQKPEEDPDLQYATELLKPGTQAPDFLLKDIDGESVRLSEFQGRSVVLVFWASWCPDCRAEVPRLKAMHAAADPDEVVFVSISFDRKFEQFSRYVKEQQLPGVQLFDPDGKKDSVVSADFGVQWIPSLYLIDPEGKVQVATVVIDKIAAALDL